VLDDWFNHPDYQGCLFLHACMAFPSPHDPIHQAASGHYLATMEAIRQMAEAAGVNVKSSEAFAREMVLLLQGLLMFRQVNQDDEAARIAKHMAERRLAEYLQT
jgi:hypothetical protein